MERRKFSPYDLPGRDIMALEGFASPAALTRASDSPDFVPRKGPGKHSIKNAVERRAFWQTADPVYLYGDSKEALKKRRQHNGNLKRK